MEYDIKADQLKQLADNAIYGTLKDNNNKMFNIAMEKIQEARKAHRTVFDRNEGLDKMMHKFYTADTKKMKELVYGEVAFWYGEYLRANAAFVEKFKHFEIAYISQLQGETENGNSINNEIPDEPA